MATRRQGIFWLLTVPYPNETCALFESGTLAPGLAWAKGQREKGEETGYVHYQVFVAFRKKVSLAGVKGMFGREVHAQLSRSEAAEAYCHKELSRDGVPFELGAKPIRRNSKTDWEAVWTAAQSGDLESIPANVRVVSYRTLRAIGSDYATCVGMQRTTFVFWGSTGTGKSRRAWDEAGEGTLTF